MSITNNLQHVQEALQEAALRNGRSSDEITLLAVAKTQPLEAVQELYQAGQRCFGENRVQEMVSKYQHQPEDLELHLIGSLQSNKVRSAVEHVTWIDSVDSLRLARLIGKEATNAGKVINILLQYNTSKESSKSGFDCLDTYWAFLDQANSIEGIRIRGLMTIGPLTDDEKQVRSAFATLRTLGQESSVRYPEYDFGILSMGMSGDFPWAIAEGSTMVRIGSALFGERTR